MKIVRWTGDPMSAVSGRAIIEVEPDEVADFDKMVQLVDGTTPNFGASISVGPMNPNQKGLRQFKVSVNRD